ncbi:hypothetical protein [Xanthomonas sp. MUS 060]|uniref:hypothetical protein n=1 Tax=Xanthomonas sp. MUS 060 TaxID=1588031 RepID=UPI000AE3D92C|nr:hypothetical protein [Xanthomonas sp. MUS 060]
MGHGLPNETLDGTQQLSDLNWIGDGGMVAGLYGFERASQAGGGINLGLAFQHGVTKHLAGLDLGTASSFQLAGGFNLSAPRRLAVGSISALPSSMA